MLPAEIRRSAFAHRPPVPTNQVSCSRLELRTALTNQRTPLLAIRPNNLIYEKHLPRERIRTRRFQVMLAGLLGEKTLLFL